MSENAIEVHPSILKLRAELRELELDVLTNFTLADAIREGASVTSKKEGGWIEAESACALGAAYLAARARGMA